MSNEPSQSAQSDINEAFEALRREVSLTRHAVERLTAARARVPDYSTPLGQIIDALKRPHREKPRRADDARRDGAADPSGQCHGTS